MAEDQDEDGEEAEDAGPTVELGEGTPVEGAPLARVAARLTWPQEKSEVVRKEGESVIRTPDGPQTLSDVLEDVETTYFGRRQDFMDAVRGVIGTGPVPSAE
ncbi:MAG: DUF5789 family protein [Halobacteriales archaeon]|nr:DUF5789 family protein [Halobacteriales archaeon]